MTTAIYRFNQSKFSGKGVDMEEVEKAIKTINEYCISNYKNCAECNIEKACEKYFNREPRKWKIPKEWKREE